LSGGPAARAANPARSRTAPGPIVDPSWAPVNSQYIGIDLASAVITPKHPTRDKFPAFDRQPSFHPGALNHPDEGGAAMVIVWVFLMVCFWIGVSCAVVFG
jgi:hypothetical protein